MGEREDKEEEKGPLRCPSSFPASVGRISPPGVCDDAAAAAAVAATAVAAGDECW